MKRVEALILLVILFILAGLVSTLFSNNTPSDLYECRVNIGGEGMVDSKGREWKKDHIYSSEYGYLGISGTYATDNPISGTDNQQIYQSERYKLFGYRFDVPNGHYKIILHFAEIYHNRKGKRLIDIKIEDKLVLSDLDIYDRVGKNSALQIDFSTKDLGIPISDNQIDIEFIKKRDDTKLSAIEVIQLPDQPTLIKFEPLKVEFGLDNNELSLTMMNVGTNKVNWSFKQGKYPRWLWPPDPMNGTIDSKDITEITIRALRANATSGMHHDTLQVVAGDFLQKIPVSIIIAGAANLVLQTPVLDFQDCYCQLPCIFKNEGGSQLNWHIKMDDLPSWVSRIYPISGMLDVGESAFLNVVISRKGLAPGDQKKAITFNSNGSSHNVTLRVNVPYLQNRHVFVDINATGLKNGSSWENAFHSIKEAIASIGRPGSQEIVEVWVAKGTYYETGIAVPSGIHLYGGFRGSEIIREERMNPQYHQTIVDGLKQGRCFECFHRTIIDGFVIENGRDWSAGEGKGAAILTYDADVTIRNNLIRNNVDSWAGALFVEGFDSRRKVRDYSPLIEHNVFIDNFSIYCAAAIEIRGSAATICNNTIVNNKGFGLEIQDLIGPYSQITYGKFHNNIVTNNIRKKQNDVWAEARKATNYSYVGKRWALNGKYGPYDYGTGNVFGDISESQPGFIDEDRGDFHLTSNSPCIDTGDPQCEKDADGTRADMGAFPLNQVHSEIIVSTKVLDFGTEKNLQTLKIKSYGKNPLEWHIVEYFPEGFIFSVSEKSGILNNGEEALININVNRISIDDNAFEGYLAVITPYQSEEVKIRVLVNNSKPKIELDPPNIDVEGIIHDTSPLTRNVNIYNSGYGNLNWKVQKKFDQSWVAVSPTFGMDKHPITLEFKTANLDYGEYREEIIISCADAINCKVSLPVLLRIKPKTFIYEIKTTRTTSLPNNGWKKTINDGESCLQAIKNSVSAPNDSSRLDYVFTVPKGVESVYVFAEVDANGSRSSDSFWTMVNGYDPCLWDNINPKSENWSRSWVYHQKRDKQHMFVVVPGKNELNLFPRESGPFINWFVITNDPHININTYKFGGR